MHSYLMLISLFYLFIYYVCQIATTYLKVVMHQKKMLLKKKVVHMHICI